MSPGEGKANVTVGRHYQWVNGTRILVDHRTHVHHGILDVDIELLALVPVSWVTLVLAAKTSWGDFDVAAAMIWGADYSELTFEIRTDVWHVISAE